jgi:hypothetical protein
MPANHRPVGGHKFKKDLPLFGNLRAIGPPKHTLAQPWEALDQQKIGKRKLNFSQEKLRFTRF